MKRRRRKRPINRTVASVELKLEALARLKEGIRKASLIFYQEARKYGVGYSEFLDIWIQAAEDVYERGNKREFRGSDLSGRD